MDARAEFARVENIYATSKIASAEEHLTNYLQTLSRQESDGLSGIDYDMARAITHERLFLIYRQMHDTNRMLREFQKSMDALHKVPPYISVDEFADKIEKSEKSSNVRWKRDLEKKAAL